LHICGRAARSILLPLNERDVSLKLTCSNFSSQVCYCSPPKIVLAKTARYRNNFGGMNRALSQQDAPKVMSGRHLPEMPLECGCSWASWTGSTYSRSYVFDFPLFYIPSPSSVSPLSIFSLHAQSQISIFFLIFIHLIRSLPVLLLHYFLHNLYSILFYYFFNLDVLFR